MFDLKVHHKDLKTGKILRSTPYKLTITKNGSVYTRDGVDYYESGEAINKPAPVQAPPPKPVVPVQAPPVQGSTPTVQEVTKEPEINKFSGKNIGKTPTMGETFNNPTFGKQQ